MKKIFNKSLLHGFLFALSYSYIGYICLISIAIGIKIDNTSSSAYDILDILEQIVVVSFRGFPINFLIISIPVYFLLRYRSQNKTLYTCSGMFFSILLQIPMYFLTAEFFQYTVADTNVLLNRRINA